MDDICLLDYQSDDLKNISALENIINTAYEGANIVDASVKTFRFLKESNILGNNYLKKLSQIIDFNRELNSLYSSIPHKVYISGISNSFSRLDDGWIIPLQSIDYGKYAHLELLAEDEDDAKLLIFSIEHYQSINSVLKSFNIKVKPSSGGGSRIRTVLETKLQDRENFLICFCDSDKLSSLSDFGTITKACRDIVKNQNFPALFFHTNGREIENDLPHYFIDEVLNNLNDPQTKSVFLDFKKIYSQIDSLIYQYTDIKEGIRIKDFNNISCTNSIDFWKNSISKLKENSLLDPNFDIEIDNESTFFITYLSKYIATNVLSWLNFEYDNKPKKVHEIIKNDTDAEAWLKHGENLFWFSCGMKKGRI